MRFTSENYTMSKSKKHELSQQSIAERYGVTSNAVFQWRKRHSDFPKGRRVGPRLLAYDVEEVDAWAKAHGKEIASVEAQSKAQERHHKYGKNSDKKHTKYFFESLS